MKEIVIVYHGLGMAGKTTNLDRIAKMYPQYVIDRFHHKTVEDRTVYLDTLVFYVPVKDRDEKIKVRLFSTPGQERFAVLRQWILAVADGFVFVVDPTRTLEENASSFREIYRPDSVKPVVVQINKIDVAKELNIFKQYFKDFPVLEASAISGDGVRDTLVNAVKLTLQSKFRK